MKIAILTLSHQPFDPRVFGKFASTFSLEGHQVTIFCPSENPVPSKNGVDFIEVPPFHGQFATGMDLCYAFGLIFRRLGSLWKMCNFASLFKPDIILATEPDTWLLGIFLKIYHHSRLIFDIHELYPVAFSYSFPYKVLKIFIILLLKAVYYFGSFFTDLVIHVSEDRSNWHRFMPVEMKLIVRNFPRIDEIQSVFSQAENPTPSDYFLIHTGPLDEDRGRDALLMAFEEIARYEYPIRLLIVGRGKNPHQTNLSERISELNLCNYITEIESVPHEEALALTYKAKVGISLSGTYQENLRLAIPQKMFEYMAVGIPIITTEGPSVKPFISETGCGILVKENKVSKLVDAILWLYKNEAERIKMGLAGKKAFLAIYNWENESRKLVDALRLFQSRLQFPESSKVM